MRPYPEEVLKAIQAGIQAHFAPHVTSSYGQSQLAYSMLLFMIATRDYDTAVPDLLDGNKQLRTLIAEADVALAKIDSDEAAAARASIAALPGPSDSLRLSALRAEHDALRAGVAGMASLIEPAADRDDVSPLRGVRSDLFAWLAADARRRLVPILSGG